MLKYRYSNNINFILTTGENGVNQYKSIGFNTDTIFQWGYFVKNRETDIKTQIITKKSKPNLLFVGRIDDNKNLLLLIDIVKKYRNLIDKFTIVGDGPLKTEMLHKIEQENQIDYKGIITNDEVINQMRLHDLFILPSKYDGWGAVVNEALHAGMRVIVSENCGAAVLLDGEVRGEKFQLKGENNFETVLVKWINKGELKYHERLAISEWAKDHISGKIAAEYFVDIINHVYTTESTSPVAPWKS
jgi:glycosyltransferase involved in cell wall biosynthesis